MALDPVPRKSAPDAVPSAGVITAGDGVWVAGGGSCFTGGWITVHGGAECMQVVCALVAERMHAARMHAAEPEPEERSRSLREAEGRGARQGLRLRERPAYFETSQQTTQEVVRDRNRHASEADRHALFS
ncbi:MAG: hypothetical protein RLZZ399_2083 [Verrucomicrobiota bacterium]|jgi:hypothetical protein